MKSCSCLQGKGLTDLFGSIAFLGFVSGGEDFFSFCFVFEREALFPGSAGEVSAVTLFPVPLILCSSLAGSCGDFSCCCPWCHPWGWGLSPEAEAWGLQGCSVCFPRPQGWNPGGGAESLHGAVL